MIELNVNFENLVHMDLEEAKKIVSYFDNECDCEDLRATINGAKYRLHIIDDGSWIDEGKYQYKDTTGVLCKIAEYDIAVTQYITRSGSYFSDYYYEYDPLEIRQLVQKTIPKLVIPERTVVTFEES